MWLEPILQLNVGQPIGRLRAAPVDLGAGTPKAFLIIYGADFDVDPYQEMFFWPTDTLKLALYTTEGQLLWKRDLGRGVVPGMWFTPVFPSIWMEMVATRSISSTIPSTSTRFR